ncbi:hypothetical protein [Raoultibacter timonensis]|uniref:hypothetical protein n=1 Tax=Raoultibacter timonensis TaxID=1907662 RepID=UPI0015E1757F|nr:hypothetical protein [Raoultibacter timonensis]
MDLQKEISFKGAKKVDYPVKTDINLMKVEVARGNTVVNVLLFLVFLVLLALFVKFAVLDPLSAGSQSNQQLANARAQLDALTAENESYTELSQEYSKYVVTGLTEEEMDLSDRNELIDLLSDTVMRATYLSSVKVVGNSVAVTCVGVGLQDVSGLVQELEQDERVAYVTVSTAQEKDEAASSATIQIVLRGSLAAGAQELLGQSTQSESSSNDQSSTTPGEDLAGALGVKGGSNGN